MRRIKFKRSGYIAQAWLVLAMAVVFGAVLAGAHIALQPKIDANKLNETFAQLPRLVRFVGPGGKVAAADPARTELWVTPDGKKAYKAFDSKGRHIGWVIKAVGPGFADKIELLIGLDKDARTITGMYVLDQKETPGLGNKIAGRQWKGKAWASQFAGKQADTPLVVVKTAPGSNGIEAISGATISSRSACAIVNNAVREFRKKMSTLRKKD